MLHTFKFSHIANPYLRRLRLLIVMMVAGLFSAQSSYANDLEGALGAIWAELPRKGELIVYPGYDSWSVYGADGGVKTVTSDQAHNGKAQSVSIKRAGQNPWDIGAQALNQLPIKSGDMIVAQVWLRAAKLPRGKTSTDLTLLLQETSEPYAAAAQSTVSVTQEWQSYYIYGRVSKDFKKNSFAAAVHVAANKQTIELGSVFILNLGAGEIDLSALPTGSAAQEQASAQAAPTPTGSSQRPVPSALQSDLRNLQARLPRAGTLMSNPAVSNWSVQGEHQSAKIVTATSLAGNKAQRVQVLKAGTHPWDVGANMPVTGAINKGDVVLLAFHARAVEVYNEAQTGIISATKIELNRAPYTSVQDGVAKLPKTWNMYYVPGKASRAYAPGEAQISLHLGAVRQTLELGPAYVINLGQGVDLSSLPSNRLDYAGREAGAQWRAQAKARIEKHRKGDLSIAIVDSSGAPISGAEVEVNMKRHAFAFGTFTNYNYGTNRAAKFPKVGQTIEQYFNSVTLPIYWADWGWQNKEMSAEFRRAIRFISKADTPWRAHPVVWPGESYMPSKILAMEPGSPAQRKAVLDHVREVMTFIKPHKPFAIDVVNEPRSNHYFEDHGDAELVPDIFRLAHEIAPDIPLFINDYSILNGSGHNQGSIDFYHEWIKKMRRKNVPLGGIGFQSHFSAGLTPPQRVYEILDGFSAYGLPLHITEFDVDTRDEQTKADYTRDFLTITFSHPSVEAFVAWGFWEGDHWKDDAAMIREDWSHKPSFEAWKSTIYEEFWTRERAQTDSAGRVTLRGFLGDYEIITTVNGVSKTQSLSLSKGGASLTVTH